MGLQFTKAKPDAGGHDGFFSGDNPRVIVKPEEFPKPLVPGDGGFFIEFEAVIEEVAAAKAKASYSNRLSACIIASGVARADQAAELVHKDWPGDIILLGAKACQNKVWRKFSLPVASNFTDATVLLNALINLAPWWVSPSSFAAKWHFMVARPEEVAGAVARGEFDVPDQVKMKLFAVVKQSDLLADQRRFTMYPEGCPPHPSYNAMHAAAAGAAVTAAKVMLVLSGADRGMMDLTAHNMAHLRATAGVHYPQDNNAGLWLGQEVVNRKLPKWMEEHVGIPAGEVEAALKEVQTNWLSV